MSRSCRRTRIALVTGLLAAACTKPAAQEESPTQIRTDVQGLVRSIANAYSRSDAAALVELYPRDDPGITSATDGHLEHGWQEIRTSIDSIAGTNGAFDISTGAVDVTPLGPGYALAVSPVVVTVNAPKGKMQFRGVMSVVARRDSTGWKIIHDHTSFQKPAQPTGG